MITGLGLSQFSSQTVFFTIRSSITKQEGESWASQVALVVSKPA